MRTLWARVGLSSCCGGELLDHGQKQLPVAVVQVGGIPPDLGEEAEFVVRKLLRLELASQRVLSEELSEWKFERPGYFGKSVQ